MNLPDYLASVCANVPKIQVAFVSPCHTAFVVQTAVGTKKRQGEKHFMNIETTHATNGVVTKAAWDVVHLAMEQFPDASGNVVSYVFHPGAGWTEAYRRQ